MEHTLINTIVISFVLAFICGMIANKLKFPALLGYLVAGIIIGPYSPGFVADTSLAQQLAEIGIILLMFGVGLHFSLSDLIRVRKIAFPGALFQMAVATSIGCVFMLCYDRGWLESLIFGFSLSVASTVVLLRALEERKTLQTETGKIAVGWLIVEDIAMIIALVLLPVLGGMATSEDINIGEASVTIFTVLLKIAGFMVLMIYFGQKLLPKLLVAISKTKSSELMTLGTLAIALGFAFVAYTAFDASFALGAFLAGLVLSESEIGYKAAEKSLPMRDAFAVLFFVSVGMLFNPLVLLEDPLTVLGILFIIVAGKAAAALVITGLFRQTKETSWKIAISLAQIGEFSFILAGSAMAQGLMSESLYNLVLAGALLSIAINPFLFKVLDRYLAKKR